MTFTLAPRACWDKHGNVLLILVPAWAGDHLAPAGLRDDVAVARAPGSRG